MKQRISGTTHQSIYIEREVDPLSNDFSRFCCCCVLPYLSRRQQRKVEIEFANEVKVILEKFTQEVPTIKFLDLSHFEIANESFSGKADEYYSQKKIGLFLFEDVPEIIDYIISQFNDSTTIKHLDLGRYKLSYYCDIRVKDAAPLLPPRTLSYAIAEKIIKIPSLRTVRTLNKGFATTLKELLIPKKSLLLHKFLGHEVSDDKYGMNEIESSVLKDLIPSFPKAVIDVVGEYLLSENIDIMIGPEIITT